MREPKSYISLLFIRYWKLCLGIVALAILLSAVVTFVMPKRYESEVKFLVNNERTDLVITPDKEQAVTPPSEVTENQVNSEMELLKNRNILDAVVRDKGLSNAKLDASAGNKARSLQRARIKLEQDLSISAVRKSNISDVSYRDSDPDRAAAVLQDLTERYLTSHLAVHGAAGTDQFFAEQVNRFNSELSQARRALAQFHLQSHLFAMPQQQTAILERYQNAEFALKDVEAQIQEETVRLTEGRRMLDQAPARVQTSVRQVSDQYALQQLEPVLNQLENKRIELTTKFKPTDRFVTEVNTEIASTRADLARIRDERVDETTTDVNPLHESIALDDAKATIELRGLQARRQAVARVASSYLQQLGSMDQSYVDLVALEEQEKQAQDNLLLYTHRLEEARVAGALDRAKFSNVAVIEQPVVSPIPVSPKLGLNLGLGALMGVFLTAGVIVMKEARETAAEPAYLDTHAVAQD